MSAWFIGRTEQWYAKVESSYATAPTFAATDAKRVLAGSKLNFDHRQYAHSPIRHADPSRYQRFTRRQKADWAVKTIWIPSGTLGTVGECDTFILNGMGTKKYTSLSTTFTGGTETSTTGTVASATGLAVGDAIQIVIAAGGSAGTYVRTITTIATADLTWTPALPAAPADADTCKAVVNYTLATALPASLDIAAYPQAPAASTPSRELLGCVVDKLVFTFDSNAEPMVEFSGPAQGLAGTFGTWTPQAQAGGYTTVGAESGIPSGLTGYFYHGATAYEITKMVVTVSNSMAVQNNALGTYKAKAFYRAGQRSVDVAITARVSDDTTIWAAAKSAATNAVSCQLGTTATDIFWLYMPAVQWNGMPTIDSAEAETDYQFQGTALSTSGNNELFIACA